ncbi:MAG: class I SAM-dependent methyltransferase [Rhodobacteraceae bacterium]|nr:class I SAM-dependent methyltransferase [Paracoccaceae bacterium]
MWENRFKASKDYVFGKAPAQFLLDHAAYLTPGATALSVGDGEGRNSVFMAEQDMKVTALEFAPTAIARAETLAAEKGVTVDFRNADVLTRDWEVDTYDLTAGIFIQFTGPDGRRKIFNGMKQATKPGGLVMLHGYTPEQIAHGTGGPPSAENMYTDVILRAAFVGWDILECRAYEREVQEGRGHSGLSALIDFVARKPA